MIKETSMKEDNHGCLYYLFIWPFVFLFQMLALGFALWAGIFKLFAYLVRDKSSDEVMTGLEYEEYCANYLRSQGYRNVRVTRASGDQGVDVLASRGGYNYAIQCKYYSGKVSNKAVQEAYSGMAYYDCDRAMVMTNSEFTQSAQELASKLGVELCDGVSPSKFTFEGDSLSGVGCLVVAGCILFISALGSLIAGVDPKVLKWIALALLGIIVLIGIVYYASRRIRKELTYRGIEQFIDEEGDRYEQWIEKLSLIKTGDRMLFYQGIPKGKSVAKWNLDDNLLEFHINKLIELGVLSRDEDVENGLVISCTKGTWYLIKRRMTYKGHPYYENEEIDGILNLLFDEKFASLRRISKKLSITKCHAEELLSALEEIKVVQYDTVSEKMTIQFSKESWKKMKERFYTQKNEAQARPLDDESKTDVLTDINRYASDEMNEDLYSDIVGPYSSLNDESDAPTIDKPNILSFEEALNLNQNDDIIPYLANGFSTENEREEGDNEQTDTLIDEPDPLLREAVETICDIGQASVSMLQRRFRIGYNRAARMIDILEEIGIVGQPDGSRPREVLHGETVCNAILEEYIDAKERFEPAPPNITKNWEEQIGDIKSWIGDIVDYSHDGDALKALVGNYFIQGCVYDNAIRVVDMLIAKNSPKTMRLYFIDGSGLLYQFYSFAPQVKQYREESYYGVEVEASIESVSTKLMRSVQERFKLLANSNARTIEKYNEKNPDVRLPYIVVFINETENYHKALLSEELQYVYRDGNSAGVHVIACSSQEFSKSVLKHLTMQFSVIDVEEALDMLNK